MPTSAAKDDSESPENTPVGRQGGPQEHISDDENITQLSARGQQRSDEQHSILSVKKRRGWVSRVLRVRDPVEMANQDPLLQERREKLISITESLDDYGFDWLVFGVAATGFFTGSYCLFVTNTVMSSIVFVYFSGSGGDESEGRHFKFWVNIITLLGAIIGQILFGVLADKLGRARFYGYELAIILVSTIGVSSTAYGIKSQRFGSSMSVEGWFYFWRLMMGIGIGAEYPLTSVLTAEWASYSSRARMLAAVFMMQPIGQLCASFAGWSAITIVDRDHGLQKLLTSNPPLDLGDAKALVDKVWRGVVGFGVLPALVAIVFRFVLPDPGRWTLEVKEDAKSAEDDTEDWLKNKTKKEIKSESRRRHNDLESRAGRLCAKKEHRDQSLKRPTIGKNDTAAVKSTSSLRPETSLRNYLLTRKNWPLLFGTCTCWFLLDLAFFGLGINSSQTLAIVWAEGKAEPTKSPVLAWNPDLTKPSNTIYDVLLDNAKKSILTMSLGSIFGSIVLLIFINRINRKKWLAWSFVVLAGFLLATGLTLRFEFGSPGSAVTITLYAICHFLFNLGPNTLTFILPAEIFPTRFRCTLHGLSAACGKLGSVIIQIIIFKVLGVDDSAAAWNARAEKLAWIIIGFSFAMLAGAPIAWICIPDVQHSSSRFWQAKESKKLEELALGVEVLHEDGQVIGVDWLKKWKPSFRKTQSRRAEKIVD